MLIRVYSDYTHLVQNEPVEMVERKGIGHPDTLADLIASAFSNRYSLYCLDTFGFVANHWVDKVLLSGAKSKVEYGKAEILKPVTVFLFGKVSRAVGKRRIPVEELFRNVVYDVLTSVFRSNEITKHVKIVVDTNDSVAKDKPPNWFVPSVSQDVKAANEALRSNDSVMCSGYSDYSQAESLAIGLENYANSSIFKEIYPETGFDVKILVTRVDTSIDVTMCLPFIAQRTPSSDYYKQRLESAHQDLLEQAHALYPNSNLSLHLNTRDMDEYGYLTVFGSALDTGDYGVVGRGNKYNGVISINREMNIEAASGKNPVYHAGKIYNVLAHEIACRVFSTYGYENYVNIAARVGQNLRTPALVVVKVGGDVAKHEKEIKDMITGMLHNIDKITPLLISTDPIHLHINGHERLSI